MTTVTQCDRCKAYVPPETATNVAAINDDSSIETLADLCQPCLKAFKVWCSEAALKERNG